MLAESKNAETDIKECSGCISEAEQCISTAEDTTNGLQAVLDKLKKQTKFLANKVDDFECRSHRNNVRILGISEKEEGSDPCSYMEKWFADNLDISLPFLERAHQVTGQNFESAPRAVIVRCLNYKDRQGILRAARVKKEGTYKQQNKIPPGSVRRSLQTTETIQRGEEKTVGKRGPQTPHHLPRQAAAHPRRAHIYL